MWIRETGTGQQVAQLHDRYNDDDDDDDDADVLQRGLKLNDLNDDESTNNIACYDSTLAANQYF